VCALSEVTRVRQGVEDREREHFVRLVRLVTIPLLLRPHVAKVGSPLEGQAPSGGSAGL
jgi:hypothetical protein